MWPFLQNNAVFSRHEADNIQLHVTYVTDVKVSQKKGMLTKANCVGSHFFFLILLILPLLNA